MSKSKTNRIDVNNFNNIDVLYIYHQFTSFVGTDLMQLSTPQVISSFVDSFKELINKSRNLTQSYQNEARKFASGHVQQ